MLLPKKMTKMLLKTKDLVKKETHHPKSKMTVKCVGVMKKLSTTKCMA